MMMIDIAVLGVVRVEREECEKIERYVKRCEELGGLWSSLGALDYFLEARILHGTAGHQPVSGDDTKSCNLENGLDTEEGFGDGEHAWCA